MVQRTSTLIYNVGTSAINADPNTGVFYVTIERAIVSPASLASPLTESRERLRVDKPTMKYVTESGQAKWDVSPAVIDGTSVEALAAVKSDMDAAIAAGAFDL